MADYSNLLAIIAANIYTNHANEVTAEMVKTAVSQVVDVLGKVLMKDASGTATTTAVIQTGVKLKKGSTYQIFYKTSTTIAVPTANIGLWVNIDGVYSQIKQYTPAELYAGQTYEYTATSDCTLYVRTTEVGVPWICSVNQVLLDFAQTMYDAIAGIDDNANPVKVAENSGISSGTTILYPSVRLLAGATYYIYAKTGTQISAPSSNIGLWIGVDGNYAKIKQYTPAELYAGRTFQYTPSVDCDLYLRTAEAGISWTLRVTTSMAEYAAVSWKEATTARIVSEWNGAKMALLGDSITAQGNGDGATTNSFLYWAVKANGVASLIVRGVGGQTYIWNKSGWYCQAGGTGGYLGRYNYDADGNILSTVVSPETATQQDIDNIEAALGVPIEIHYGAMCSWDRITTMIPESMRLEMDAVLICAGTNDLQAVEEVDVDGDISAAEPAWIPNDATDPDWSADSDFYAGGDYDISTFSGAIASTLMKLRLWCPNAVIIVATPFPRFNLSTKQQYTNSAGVSFREMCEIQRSVAGLVSAPVIDANGENGISGADFSAYVVDGVHPNLAGRKMYGRPFIGGLAGIAKKIL